MVGRHWPSFNNRSTHIQHAAERGAQLVEYVARAGAIAPLLRCLLLAAAGSALSLMGAAPSSPVAAGERVWVTGASGGLGEAVSLGYAARGAKLVLSARRKDELERVAEACAAVGAASAEVVVMDQADGASVAAALAEALAAPLDAVVLNGGVGSRSTVAATDDATLRRIMDVNFLSHAKIGKACAAHFADRGAPGRVVVVSSVQAFFGLPGRAPYAASKHALHGYFDALRAEVAAAGVSVTTVCPGYVRTGHSVHALTGSGAAHGRDDPSTARGADPADVAAALIDAADRRESERVVAPGASAVAARLLRALAPNALFGLMAKRAAKEQQG